VDITFYYKIVPPLTRSESLANSTLARFKPFTGAMGTNFLIKDSEIVAELDRVLKDRLVLIGVKQQLDRHGGNFQDTLDAAIKNATRSVREELHKYIVQMDPVAFEWLVRALFLKLGYKKICVTKRSGDHGIDVTANLVAGGVANIQTCIQVKRQQSVGRPVVQSLRGSLSAHEAGLVVTSGHFTDGAIEEAKDPKKVPITLIGGLRLTQLLLEHEIGIEHNKVTLYHLRLGELSQEQLEARVEEDDGSESGVE
jgi:restriction endonuclease Mrr